MSKDKKEGENWILSNLGKGLRRCLFSVLSAGPIPDHVAFILDGNRRYAKKHNLTDGAGHRLGFATLISMLMYCYELGIKHVTIYAFSIDNFKRRPEEVQSLMELLHEKMESLQQEESIVHQHNIRVHFAGDLTLLSEVVRQSATRLMNATSKNSKVVLTVCMAYTSTNEILRAVQQSCEDKWNESRASQSCGAGYDISKCGMVDRDRQQINVTDIEKHMDLAIAPDPDIIVRTSGETRLSNFLLWQSAWCLLYSPSALWPEIGIRHLVCAVLKFQRLHPYIEKKRKKS